MRRNNPAQLHVLESFFITLFTPCSTPLLPPVAVPRRYDPEITAYTPHSKEWIKKRIFNQLKQLAGK
jgi:hypothetical protein